MEPKMTPEEQRTVDQIVLGIDSNTLMGLEQAAKLILAYADFRADEENFQRALFRLLCRWRRRYSTYQQDMKSLTTRATGRLLKLTSDPVFRHRSKSLIQNDAPVCLPIICPTRRPESPSTPITLSEIAGFFDMLEQKGFGWMFGPGTESRDGKLIHRSLITIDDVVIEYQTIYPRYQAGLVKREWDPSKRIPEIALALDLTLLAANVKRKWTYRVCDEFFKRLPACHRYFPSQGKRPGWRTTTRTLERIGLFDQISSQTWALSNIALRTVADQIVPAWKNGIHGDAL